MFDLSHLYGLEASFSRGKDPVKGVIVGTLLREGETCPVVVMAVPKNPQHQVDSTFSQVALPDLTLHDPGGKRFAHPTHRT